jgi:hypothetical protein
VSATVRTPVEGYCGEVAGVVFTNGVGVCDGDASYFVRHGYTVEPVAPVEPEETTVKTRTAKK